MDSIALRFRKVADHAPRSYSWIMLGGGTSHEFAGARMRYHLAFGRSIRVYALERDRLLYDSAFVAPFEGQLAGQTVYYAVLSGTLLWRSPEERFDGPCLLRISPATLDGELGLRVRSFCNYGTPLHLVVFWAPTEEGRPAPPTGEVERVDAPSALMQAFVDYHAAALSAKTIADVEVPGEALVSACERAGLTSPELRGAFEARWGSFAERTFGALHRAWSHRAGLPALSDLSQILGLSGSQLTRDIRSLASAIAVPGARWRKTMLDWRIRQATTLLSAQDATVSSVAEEVGYGSVEAMGRAFRDAKIPPPTEVRLAMRATIEQLMRHVETQSIR